MYSNVVDIDLMLITFFYNKINIEYRGSRDKKNAKKHCKCIPYLLWMWTLTSLSYQFAILNTGSAESTGVSSSVYVFTRILELYLRDSKLYTIYRMPQNRLTLKAED